MPDKNLPIISVGAGGIVRDAHLPAYKIAGFEVCGITDLDRDKAKSLAKDFGIKAIYSDVNEAIAKAPVGAVFDIAVPASALLGLLPLFPRKANLLIQKPMGENIKEAEAILKICREREFLAAVNFQLRFAPNMIAARSLIQQGLLGELHNIEAKVTVYTPWHLWEFLQKIPRLEILYHSIHYIDLIRSFYGDPKSVFAKTVKHPKSMNLAPVRSVIAMDYGEVRRATITTNHAHEFGSEHQESYFLFEGTKGAARVGMGVNMDYPKGIPDTLEYQILDAGQSTKWQDAQIKGSWFPEAFVGTMASVMNTSEDSKIDLPTHVEDAFKTMACVEAAYISSEKGGEPLPSYDD